MSPVILSQAPSSLDHTLKSKAPDYLSFLMTTPLALLRLATKSGHPGRQSSSVSLSVSDSAAPFASGSLPYLHTVSF